MEIVSQRRALDRLGLPHTCRGAMVEGTYPARFGGVHSRCKRRKLRTLGWFKGKNGHTKRVVMPLTEGGGTGLRPPKL
jgi:hypothetical protein